MVRVLAWGTGVGIRIPKDVFEHTGFHIGQEVDISAVPDGVMIRPTRPVFSLEELASRITPENRHELIDFGADVGKEIIDE